MIINNKDIVIIILFIIIIILIKINLHVPKSTNTTSEIITEEESFLIKQINNDKKYITDIIKFINNNIIKTSDIFTLPSFTVNNLYLNNDIELSGSSKIENNLIFSDISTSLDIFPRYSIIIYHNNIETLPTGWVLCDGKIWWKHKTDNNIKPVSNRPIMNDDYDEIVTPDLRGRFIYGASTDSFSKIGGYEMVTLTEPQIPPHAHPSYMVYNDKQGIKPIEKINNKSSNTPYKLFSEINIMNEDTSTYLLDTSDYGTFAYNDSKINYIGALPHNNMPPYLTSYYIMKL